MSNSPQPSGLIALLLNLSAEFGDRHDAAMDLGAFDDDEVEGTLISITADPKEDEDIIDAAGESLSEIWNRKDKRDDDVISKMCPAAKRYFE